MQLVTLYIVKGAHVLGKHLYLNYCTGVCMVYVDQLPLSLSFQGVDHYIFMTVYILFNQLLGDST